MPMLIRKFLPHGLYGVMVVGLIAGVFSSADSQINAFCAMFTHDIYKRLIDPGRTERYYLTASKIFGVLFTLAAIGTAFIFKLQTQGMLIFAISVLATIMPPFAAITILGTFWRRANGTGALAGLIAGGITAIALVILDYYGNLKPLADQSLYLRVMITFPLTMIVTIVVSLISFSLPSPAAEEVNIDTHLPWKLLAGAAALVISLFGLLLFWTYYFHEPIGAFTK
jgi:SSS family solute:Na+ symporter